MLTVEFLTIDDVVKYYRDPKNVRAEMCRYKWPDGMKCTCGSVDFYPTKGRPSMTCLLCRAQLSYKQGTFCEGSHIPASAWLAAIRIFGNPRLETTPKAFAKKFGVSYPGALRILKKVGKWLGDLKWREAIARSFPSGRA